MKETPSKSSIVNSVFDSLLKNGNLLGLSELGIGSLLHGLKIPLAGQILSLNQILILSNLSRPTAYERSRFEPFRASCQASLIKAFSPAGKRLTPMIAISVQGFLFSIGTFLFGYSALGVFLGALLASLWSFAQPLLFMTLFFGERFWSGVRMIAESLEKIFTIQESWMLTAVCAFVILKMIFAELAAGFGFFGSMRWFRNYRGMILEQAQRTLANRDQKLEETPQPFWKLAIKDLTRPFFIFGLTLTTVYVYFETGPMVAKIWILARSLGCAYLGFMLLRHPRIENWFIAKIKTIQPSSSR